MDEYHIVWEIDVTAGGDKDAAKVALEIMRDPESTATFFWVGKKKKKLLSFSTYQRIDAAIK